MRYIISKRAIAILFGIISLSFYSGDTYAKCLTKEAPSRPPCCKYKCRFLQPPSPHHWYVDVGVGKSYDFAHDNTIAQMEDAAGQLLFKTDTSASPAFFSAGVGHIWFLQGDYLPAISVGLQYRYTSPTLMTGIIYDVNEEGDINLQQSLFSRYQVKQRSLLLITKLDLYRWKNVMPYFSFGLGASWNRINNFSTLAFDPDLIPLPLVAQANTTTDFSYSLGAGIDYAVNPALWLSLGYSYDDFGKNKIGNLFVYENFQFPLIDIQTTVKNSSLYSHNILLTARYLFG
ncbi:outer membrane protein [Rickettsiella endosymbiont of Litargus connexus]|uniref:outer membrane protein n=1 Tax=Rickettsiella endosymbiont of Litargus connexus TaxID=3066237 RepID=UPI00376F1E3E|nr:outer membrane beta-barrel protein [Gammaproteobacteria bacterium]MCH9755102.1 outer membrane beta-barrel protein [Gammaproteobacteria bacterium]MDD4892687.1 outer membrane beta-barrel protein [Candidatus Rickettsiella isopodorum]MDD5162237.1 outer membrane beta-barrel protein [Candidatus Rickettsiella isopodorum]